VLHRASDRDEGLHLRGEARGHALLQRVDDGVLPVARRAAEELPREGAVRVHAVKAVVRGRHGGRQELALAARERRAGEVVDEERVGEAAQVHGEAGREVHRREDAGKLGQPAHDGRLCGPDPSFVVACHGETSAKKRSARARVQGLLPHRKP
jgi:hypothetical protein